MARRASSPPPLALLACSAERWRHLRERLPHPAARPYRARLVPCCCAIMITEAVTAALIHASAACSTTLGIANTYMGLLEAPLPPSAGERASASVVRAVVAPASGMQACVPCKYLHTHIHSSRHFKCPYLRRGDVRDDMRDAKKPYRRDACGTAGQSVACAPLLCPLFLLF